MVDTRRIVLIPTYNESDNVIALVEAALARPVEADVLVIDDASPDGTGELVAQLAATNRRVRLLKRHSKNGLGRAYVDAFKQVLSEDYARIFHMDADFSHDPTMLDSLDAALEDADLVIGSRYVPGGGIRGWGRHRRVLSRFASIYAPGILGIPVRDLTGGYKGFRRETLARLPLGELSGIGYFFLIETTYYAWISGARIKEVPILFDERREGQSKMGFAIMLEAAVKVPWLRLSVRRP